MPWLIKFLAHAYGKNPIFRTNTNRLLLRETIQCVTNYFSGFYFSFLLFIYESTFFLMLTIYMINDQTHKTQNWNFKFSLCIEEPQKNRFRFWLFSFTLRRSQERISIYFSNVLPIFILTNIRAENTIKRT